MFITPALAQGGPSGFGNMEMLLPLVAIMAIMYFVMIRPQQKRAKEHKDLITGLNRGDVIVTAGGFVGKITKIISFEDIQIELAKGVNATIKRSSIQSVQVKTAATKSKLSKKKVPEAQPEENKSLFGSLFGKK